MLRTLILGALLITGAAVLTPVRAAPLAPQSVLDGAAVAEGNLLTEVRRRGGGGRFRGGGRGRSHFRGGGGHRFRGGHRHRRRGFRSYWYGAPSLFYFYEGESCSYWLNRCARWNGWRTRGYYRCLRRHGC